MALQRTVCERPLKAGARVMGQGSEKVETVMAEMTHNCTSCGECVRPCSFLQRYGTPAAIAQKNNDPENLLTAYGCSLCGLCDAVCPEGLSPSTMFHAMRQEAAVLKLVDLKTYKAWLNYEKLGGTPLFRRDSIPDGCTTVFFPGCSLPGIRPQTVLTLLQKLQKSEPTTGLILDCCGKISHDLGLTAQFEAIFGKLSERLKDSGVTRILTSCPGCSKILGKYGDGFKVASIYEVLSAEDTFTLHLPQQQTIVTIHDPCPARFDDVQQQAVRKLVTNAGYTIEELPEHGRTTRCCGQGGMVEGCIPGTVRHESRLIAAEAAGRKVVTSCGACCDTLSVATPTVHVADLLNGGIDYLAKPVSSAKRWMNRLKLRFARLL
jgi:Fe-S oxidoreductase